ncbi:MAG: hypothetical protein R3D67_02630 [Hyphomicrobiaceae bacterium]
MGVLAVAGVGLALFVVAPALAPTTPPVEHVAGTTAAAPAEKSVADKIANFLQKFYLSGSNLSDEEILQLYAPKVDYFGDQVLTPSEIVADKRNYYRRWPQRQYRLLRDTLSITTPEGQPRIYNVSFEYLFDVSRGREVSRGRGRTVLTLDLQLDGGMITRETGTVLERHRSAN